MTAALLAREMVDGRERIAFRPHGGQWQAWTAPERFVALIAGSGGGKTSFGVAWLLREITGRPGEYLAVSPTNSMLERVLAPQIMLTAAAYGAQHFKGEPPHIRLGDSIIHLLSADKPERAEGVHARGAWLDEAGQMSATMWEVARRRVAGHQGRILLTTTPYDMGWLKTQVADRAANGEPEYRVVTFPSTANPAYPRDEFERARRELSPERFAMFYLGEFRRASGLVYPDWSPARMTVDAAPGLVRSVGGLDLGWHNPTAGLLLGEDADGAVYVTAEHYAAEATLADHAAALKQRGSVRWYADPSAAQSIEELRKLGVWIAPAENDVVAGIDAVTRLIRTDRLRVVRGAAPNLLREFESYVWEQKDGVPLDKPRKADDHAMDALRYGIMALGGKRGMRAW